MTTRILTGDARDVLKTLLDNSIDCVVTSPPYFGLRDYGNDGQIGLEASPQKYVAEMVAIFREVRRVLKKTGTLWLNLGDSYATAGGYGGDQAPSNVNGKQRTNEGSRAKGQRGQIAGLKHKDLVGIPWRVAFALQDDGWYLRQDIIWHKLNPMPESVRDRCTKAHEYLFLLSKSARYHYDGTAIAEKSTEPDRPAQKTYGRPLKELYAQGPMARGENGKNHQFSNPDRVWGTQTMRNKRSVWSLVSRPFPGAHFATFPPKLVELCLKAGCPEKICSECGKLWMRYIEKESRPNAAQNCNSQYPGYRGISGGVGNDKRAQTELGFRPTCHCNAASIPGTVLDPFGGAGTTSLVADRMGLNSVMIELNPEYAEMARWRLIDEAGMFAELAAE